MSREDLSTQVFGRLTVLSVTDRRIRGNVVWDCQCSCGTKTFALTTDLKSGSKKSCGCYKAEINKEVHIHGAKSKGKTKYTIDAIKKLVMGTGCTLISTEFNSIHRKLVFKCACGQEFSKKLHDFLNQNKSCPACSYKKSQDNRRLTISYISDWLLGKGVTLLSTSYDNKDKPLHVKCKCGNEFYRTFGSFRTQGAHFCDSCTRFNSSVEDDVLSYLKEIHVTDYETRDSALIKPHQIDILFKTKGLGIEVNGLYWHSEISGGKGREYHKNKWLKAKTAGCRIIFISDHEWAYKKDLCKKLLSTFLVSDRKTIYARKTLVREVPTAEAKDFLNSNHFQGYTGAAVRYGLFYEDSLVSIMTFGKSRFGSLYEWEIIRYCNKDDWNIPGAAQKLFSHFLRTQSPKSIVSYCDISKFSGVLYEKLGLKFSHYSDPGYLYVKHGKITSTTELFSRQKFQKHKLQKLLPVFDPSLSEWENMKNNGYDRYWDCGNSVYVWTNEQ